MKTRKAEAWSRALRVQIFVGVVACFSIMK